MPAFREIQANGLVSRVKRSLSDVGAADQGRQDQSYCSIRTIVGILATCHSSPYALPQNTEKCRSESSGAACAPVAHVHTNPPERRPLNGRAPHSHWLDTPAGPSCEVLGNTWVATELHIRESVPSSRKSSPLVPRCCSGAYMIVLYRCIVASVPARMLSVVRSV